MSPGTYCQPVLIGIGTEIVVNLLFEARPDFQMVGYILESNTRYRLMVKIYW